MTKEKKASEEGSEPADEKPSKEFTEKIRYLEEQEKLNLKTHERKLIEFEKKMEELKFIRESDHLHHERELERGRIKGAEIRKDMQRRSDFEFMKQNRYKEEHENRR